MAQPAAAWYQSYNPLRLCNLAYQGAKKERTIPFHQTPPADIYERVCRAFEHLGDGILTYTLTDIENVIPRIHKTITNPQVIVVSVATTALFLNSYLHYPTETLQVASAAAVCLGLNKYVTLENVRKYGKFTIYAEGMFAIAGYAGRTGGRLTETYINALNR